MGYKIITAPALEPVTIAEARNFLQMGSDTSQDNLISLLIQSAREGIERELGRALITQTIEEEFTDIIGLNFTLSFAPVSRIISIRSFDDDETECDISEYWKELITEPIRIQLKAWPANIRTLKIKYVAGYASSDEVPARLKEAILVNVRQGFDKRQNDAIPEFVTVSQKLSQTFRLWFAGVNS